MFRYAASLIGVVLALACLGGANARAAAPPEGPRLAVIKWDFLQERYELVTVDRSGAQPLRLAGGGERTRPLPEIFESPTWSPDGSSIVFVAIAHRLEGGLGGIRLYIVGADGRGLRPLLGTRGAVAPVLAPDAHSVAFARFWRQGASVWFADLAGGAPRRVTAKRRAITCSRAPSRPMEAPCWRPASLGVAKMWSQCT